MLSSRVGLRDHYSGAICLDAISGQAASSLSEGLTAHRKRLSSEAGSAPRAVKGCAGVWVATDDERIAAEVERFGGQVVMTSP